jgi:hypothetical protein
LSKKRKGKFGCTEQNEAYRTLICPSRSPLRRFMSLGAVAGAAVLSQPRPSSLPPSPLTSTPIPLAPEPPQQCDRRRPQLADEEMRRPNPKNHANAAACSTTRGCTCRTVRGAPSNSLLAVDGLVLHVGEVVPAIGTRRRSSGEFSPVGSLAVPLAAPFPLASMRVRRPRPGCGYLPPPTHSRGPTVLPSPRPALLSYIAVRVC